MSNIKVKAVDQNIAFTDSPKIYSGDVNTDYVHFSFDDVWNGFIKTAVFYREVDKPYFQVLADDECIVPKEVMAEPGKFFMGVVGVLDDKVITSEVIGYDIGQGIMSPVETPPTEDIWQQILAELNIIRVLANQIKQDQTQFIEDQNQAFNDYTEKTDQVIEEYKDRVFLKPKTGDGRPLNLCFKVTDTIQTPTGPSSITVSPNMGIKIVDNVKGVKKHGKS